MDHSSTNDHGMLNLKKCIHIPPRRAQVEIIHHPSMVRREEKPNDQRQKANVHQDLWLVLSWKMCFSIASFLYLKKGGACGERQKMAFFCKS